MACTVGIIMAASISMFDRQGHDCAGGLIVGVCNGQDYRIGAIRLVDVTNGASRADCGITEAPRIIVGLNASSSRGNEDDIVAGIR